MLWRDTIDLVSVTYQQDDNGEWVADETKRQVMADKQSVRQSEFYQAAMAGLRPEIMFLIRSVEYQGEQQLEYDSRRYNIIRTYDKDGEFTELVCERLPERETEGGS